MDFILALFTMDYDSIMNAAPSWLFSDLTRQVFLFTLAAWIHSGRVKKEIKEQFQTLTHAIYGVKSELGVIIDDHADRIDRLEKTMKKGGP